jgi:hypothetical protein
MKRSEMLKLMANSWDWCYDIDSIEALVTVMDGVLKVCEESGMRPPAIPVTCPYDHEGLIDYHYYWEPE